MQQTPDDLGSVYQQACLAEIEALKPGNVHIFFDGHGMVVDDFIKSAVASKEHMGNPSSTLGERIYNSVEATWRAVGCNTNLGIILLCGPLIQAKLMGNNQTFKQNLETVLTTTTIQDAQWVFDAIKRASPAGLGRVDEQDVNQKASCTLLEAMALASEKDSIALQYHQHYQYMFEEALPFYNDLLKKWARPAWATTGVYLFWLSHFLDSHIVRKYGQGVAQSIADEANKHLRCFQALENPKTYLTPLLTFDQKLKQKGHNPGTSADLTVATVMLSKLLN